MREQFKLMFEHAMELNKENIIDLIEQDSSSLLLDLGCDDGHWTSELANRIGTESIYGVEIVKSKAKEARNRGINIIVSDLNRPLPFQGSSFDVVHANQVIEHLSNLDLFVSEIFRILKPGGYIIISTENASSWHNIFASIMGWQIFSLTNMSSKKLGIGNPLAPWRNETKVIPTWTHKTIFNYLGLKEFLECHGFVDHTILGAGYYPLPPYFGKLDPRHAHFISIKARKS